MEKTDSFSLYDVLTFIIPGFVLVMFLYAQSRTMGWELQPLAAAIPDNVLLSGIAVFSGAFVTGFIIHYINEHQFFFIGRLRRRFNNKVCFVKKQDLANATNKLVKERYGWDIIDADLNPTDYADDIFEIYYNQFFNEKKLRVFNRYQLPFFMFANLTLVLIFIGCAYGVCCFFIMGSSLITDKIFVVSCFLFAMISYKISYKHRQRFIEVMWLTIFAELKSKLPN